MSTSLHTPLACQVRLVVCRRGRCPSRVDTRGSQRRAAKPCRRGKGQGGAAELRRDKAPDERIPRRAGDRRRRTLGGQRSRRPITPAECMASLRVEVWNQIQLWLQVIRELQASLEDPVLTAQKQGWGTSDTETSGGALPRAWLTGKSVGVTLRCVKDRWLVERGGSHVR